MIHVIGGREVFVAYISARRANNVPKAHKFIEGTWFVAEGEEAIDRDVGANTVIESGVLCRSRNEALELAALHEVPCLQLSDDLTKLEEPYDLDGKWKARPLAFEQAVERMLLALDQTGAKLVGVAPTSNAFYYGGKPVRTNAFIVGDMFIAAPGTPRFDEELRLKEDYDFTLAHVRKYGTVARCDNVLASFAHRSNKGGAVAYRTPEAEQEAIAVLKRKWPGLVVDNPRRPNEVLLKVK